MVAVLVVGAVDAIREEHSPRHRWVRVRHRWVRVHIIFAPNSFKALVHMIFVLDSFKALMSRTSSKISPTIGKTCMAATKTWAAVMNTRTAIMTTTMMITSIMECTVIEVATERNSGYVFLHYV